jgi:hypothetical protein
VLGSPPSGIETSTIQEKLNFKTGLHFVVPLIFFILLGICCPVPRLGTVFGTKEFWLLGGRTGTFPSLNSSYLALRLGGARWCSELRLDTDK